jgi:hypothetical protein
MATVDLGALPRDVNLMVLRAGSIEGYANVEQALCHLFASLMGTPMDKAGVVFFRITNSHSRNTIIERLLKKVHNNQYDTF